MFLVNRSRTVDIVLIKWYWKNTSCLQGLAYQKFGLHLRIEDVLWKTRLAAGRVLENNIIQLDILSLGMSKIFIFSRYY